MALDLTLTSAAYAAGKFANGLSAGYARAAGIAQSGGTFTIECWAKCSTPTQAAGIIGSYGFAAICHTSAGKIYAVYGTTTGALQIDTTFFLTDGVMHHFELVVGPDIGGAGVGGLLFIDGVKYGQNGNGGNYQPTLAQFTVGAYSDNGNVAIAQFNGTIDEVAVWNIARHTSAFTPPTAPYAGTETGLVALYHLDGNGLDSKGTAATAVTLSGPATAVVGTASSAYTVGANGILTGSVTVTPSDNGGGGAFTPASAVISSGTPTATFTYTASSVGAKTIGVTNNGGLTNPASVTTNVSASDTTPPAFASAQVANTNPSVILVTMNEALAASVPPNNAFTPSGGRTVTSVSVSGLVASVTVNTPYANGDVITIGYTQPGANPRLQDAAGNPATTFTAQPAANNIAAAVAFTDKLRFSPYNWNVTPTMAKSINAGAYFKTVFTAASCSLVFDLSGAMANSFSFMYRIDLCGPWRTVTVSSAVIPLDMTGSDSGFATTGHFLEVIFKGNNVAASQRWSPQACAMVLTGITLAAGGALSLPLAVNSRRILFYGDSITEGVEAHFDGNDASNAWTFLAGSALGAEFGIVGFASQGWNAAYNPPAYSPFFPATWNYIYEGVPRDLSSNPPDLIVINHGTNDSTDVTAIATSTINAILSATPATTKIVVMQPLGGGHGSQLQAAVAAVANARCTYLGTAGWYSGPTHPAANYAATAIAPLAVNALSAVLAGTVVPALTARTVSLTLGDALGALANLTGLKVAFYDEPTPDLHSVPRYKTAAGTTNASGALSFSVQSTLASGAAGCVVVQMADGRNLVASVAVA